MGLNLTALWCMEDTHLMSELVPDVEQFTLHVVHPSSIHGIQMGLQTPPRMILSTESGVTEATWTSLGVTQIKKK